MIERVVRGLMDRKLLKEPTPFEQTSWEEVAQRPTRSLGRDVFVAALDPDDGQVPASTSWGIRAALLVELRLEGRIEVSGTGSKATATVCDPHALGDRELDIALQRLNVGSPQKVVKQAAYLPSQLHVIESLAGDGQLAETRHQRLGVFSARRLELSPDARRADLVDRLASALRGVSVPDERTALLIAVLSSFVPFKRFVPKEQVKQARRRGEEITAAVAEDHRVLIDAVKLAQSKDSSGGDVAFT